MLQIASPAGRQPAIHNALVNQIESTRSPLLTRDEAAKYLRLAPQTLAQWASNRRYHLPVTKIGRRAMYRQVDLDAFIAHGLSGGQLSVENAGTA
jgi:hypothetical protein